MAKVLIIGSGGREHALALALKRSPKVAQLAFAGGENVGLEAIAARVADAKSVASAFDLVVIGPEAPLVAGLADQLRERVPVFGPSAAAARLEASKAFTKAICAEASIPTARAQTFEDRAAALAGLSAFGDVVVKADGLAAGKGVTVARDHAEAAAAIEAAFDGVFGAAGHRVVLEEQLFGPEVSLFALCDGTVVRPLATARDFKRAHDGGTGPNTGGMGAVSPAPDLPPGLVETAMETIVRPAIAALNARGTPYVGVLYAGLMLTAAGPKLIEFNVRFGDPEAQVVLPRLTTDPFDILLATATGRLGEMDLALSEKTAVGVVAAAKGYPAAPTKGHAINGLDQMPGGVSVIHAGTRLEGGRVVSHGGRVLCLVALGEGPAAARAQVYEGLSALDFPGGFWRSDIAA
ncbi:MAG: phosphoribosylamine--glycine ligase [Pseudomonadota bacterium]